MKKKKTNNVIYVDFRNSSFGIKKTLQSRFELYRSIVTMF